MRSIDRISALPDSILHYVLSMLPMKEAIRTNLLAKRWEHLWKGLPSLILSSKEFRGRSEFVHFVDLFLKQRKKKKLNLDTFKLSWVNDRSTVKAVERWLAHVAVAKPRVIALEALRSNSSNRTERCLNFTDDLFTIESLEELTLRTEGYCSVELKSVNLKCLRKLEIRGTISLDGDRMKKLMCGSPVLEELTLYCSLEGFIVISSKSLRHLEIFCEGYPNTDKLEISTPSLQSLYLENAEPGRITCKNLASLVEVYVYLDSQDYDGRITFLSAFSNAEKLEFADLDFLSMFTEELPNLPIFNNLKELTVMASSSNEIVCFLQHAPELEKLTLRYNFGLDGSYSGEEYYSCKKLKTVEVYHGNAEEADDALNLLSYNIDKPLDMDVKFKWVYDYLSNWER